MSEQAPRTCAECGAAPAARNGVCNDCAHGDGLPPCVGAAYADLLRQQFDKVFGPGAAE